MLKKLSANKSSFHEVVFKGGLNVIVADTVDNSSSQDTRNSRGKTTLFKIINYCLGSAKPSEFRADELRDWVFTLDLVLFNNDFSASRGIEEPNKIYIEGPLSMLPLDISKDEDGSSYIHIGEWKELLSSVLFNSSYNSKISFRSLISYFVRIRKDAYLKPEKYYSAQSKSGIQYVLSYLLGLNVRYATEWYDLNERSNNLKYLGQNNVDDGVIDEGDLTTKKIQLEERLNKNRNSADNIKVHQHYENVQQDNDQLTRQLHQATNKMMVLRKKLESYQVSVSEEKYPDDAFIENIYNEVNIFFPEQVKKTLGEARAFHKEVVENRRLLISSEVTKLKKAISVYEDHVESLIVKRSGNIEFLENHGALSELVRINEEQSLIQQELQDVERQLEEISKIDKVKKDISDKKDEVRDKARIYHKENDAIWSEAIKLFNNHTKSLYGDKINGNLVINITKDGYDFNISIPKSDGDGVSKMTIFAFDLMLLEVQKAQGRGLDFLIHDSMLFDGVDSRQVASALELAEKVCSDNNLQYICAFNSDDIPYDEFEDDFYLDENIVLRLSDIDSSGSLLGIDF